MRASLMPQHRASSTYLPLCAPDYFRRCRGALTAADSMLRSRLSRNERNANLRWATLAIRFDFLLFDFAADVTSAGHADALASPHGATLFQTTLEASGLLDFEATGSDGYNTTAQHTFTSKMYTMRSHRYLGICVTGFQDGIADESTRGQH